MKFNKKIILPLAALAAVAIILTAVTAALLTTQTQIPATGTIEPTHSPSPTTLPQPITSINVEIYTDAATTTPLTSLSWGTLSAGATVSRTIYIKNSGTTAETLNMTTTQWNPAAASSVLTLTWNKEASTLDAGAVVPATLTLQVAANPDSVTNFSMNIVITGTA
ncbi:hypothetical protein GX563_02310 [Candidatus Bathyarchaeota archaeon]|nr:hypothetical protein [Candidatus Bathyarchaeota archaeon]